MSRDERQRELDRERGRRYRERHPERVRAMARQRMAKRRSEKATEVKEYQARKSAEYRARVIVDLRAALIAAADRFWSFVDKGAVDECWPWRGSNDGHSGYGRFCLTGGKRVVASRAAYLIANGPLTDEEFACHRCDNPPCCNPAHLFAGTTAENNADCNDKGRRGKRPRKKITDEQAAAIVADQRTHHDIAAAYGISRVYVTKLKSRAAKIG